MLPFDRTYNVEQEFYQCLERVCEILDFLEDISIALERKESLIPILHPPFNPLRTIRL